MKIFETILKIQTLAPSLGQDATKRAAVGIEIKLLRFLAPGFDLVLEDVLISSEDIAGWSVANDGPLTVALDITITDDLKKEGIARDFVNRIQNMRKDMGLEVLDKIGIEVEKDGEVVTTAITEFKDYIRVETQALTLEFKEKVADATEVDMDEFSLKVKISVK